MNRKRLNAIIETLHLKRHMGTCADMHPLVHAEHMVGIRNRALQILAAELRGAA